jgi:Fe-S-cluster containining protein
VLRLQFFQTQREDRKITKDLEKNFQQLSNLLIDSKSSEFSLLIKDIFEACEALKSDSEPEEAYGINELQFRAFLEKIFLQMEKYSDK